MLAAGMEVATGMVLIASPSLFAGLLFGSGLASPGPGIGRMAGFALLSLALACWPTRDAAAGPALRALLLFSVLSALYLAYRGIRGGATGPLLWPAAALHACFAMFLSRAMRSERGAASSAPAGGRSNPA